MSAALILALADGIRQGDILALALVLPWCLAFLGVTGAVLYGTGWAVYRGGRIIIEIIRRIG